MAFDSPIGSPTRNEAEAEDGGGGAVKLVITPISISDASAFVSEHHRHHRAPQGGLFAVAASQNGEIVAVAIVGRPVARMLQDGWTAEVIRLASNGVKNACSMLYGAAWRAARALGYKRLITYILDTEPGTTLKAAGWKLVGNAGGGSWSRKERPRVDRHPTQGKMIWQRTASAGCEDCGAPTDGSRRCNQCFAERHEGLA